MKKRSKSSVVKSKVFDKYWICFECSHKQKLKLPPNYIGTVISGRCGWCKDKLETTLIPVCDFGEGSYIWD